jgi:predicted DNA binding CopG/RHH family protein
MAQGDTDDFDGPAQAARTPTSDIFGKLDDEIPPIRVNGDALLAIKRKATANGMTLSEYVRLRLYVDVCGLEHVLMLQENRTRRATGNASQGDPVQLAVVEQPAGAR